MTTRLYYISSQHLPVNVVLSSEHASTGVAATGDEAGGEATGDEAGVEATGAAAATGDEAGIEATWVAAIRSVSTLNLENKPLP